jgi:hypothetical protein
MDKLNDASTESALSYSDDNIIGNIGCKYLSRVSFNHIENLCIGKSKVMKVTIRLEAKEHSTSPRRSGVHLIN